MNTCVARSKHGTVNHLDTSALLRIGTPLLFREGVFSPRRPVLHFQTSSKCVIELVCKYILTDLRKVVMNKISVHTGYGMFMTRIRISHKMASPLTALWSSLPTQEGSTFMT